MSVCVCVCALSIFTKGVTLCVYAQFLATTFQHEAHSPCELLFARSNIVSVCWGCVNTVCELVIVCVTHVCVCVCYRLVHTSGRLSMSAYGILSLWSLGGSPDCFFYY